MVESSRVLFFNISVVFRATISSVCVGATTGRFINPAALTMVRMDGFVNVLFVNVSVVFRPTNVVVASGSVIALLFVFDVSNLVNVPFCAAVVSNINLVAPSIALTICVLVSIRFLFDNVSVVARPTRVSVAVGNVSVPVLLIAEMIGLVSVLFVNVSVVARPTRVSVALGRVSTLFTVCDPVIVVVVPAVPAALNAILIVGSVASTIAVVVSTSDLLVNVSVVALPTSVSVASGRVTTLFAVCPAVIVVLVDVVPDASNKILFVLSALSIIAVELSTSDLFVKVTVEAAPIKVSGPVGRVIAPPLLIDEIVGNVNVLFVRVSVVARPTNVSVASGKVITLFAVWAAVIVVLVEVVPPALNPILFVASRLSTTKTVESTRDLFANVSVVSRPTNVSVVVGKVSVPPLFMLAIVGNVKVLFVSVSVVARPTNVSVVVGRVSVPVFTMVAMTGAVRVLFVRVSVVARPTSVSVVVGKVNVPVFTIVAMTGAVRVLFVRVSVVVLPTNVSVVVGRVSVPVFTMVAITGAVSVLFVRVSVVALPTNVSVEVGRVSVPVFTIVAITGAVRVLFVNVSVVVLPTNVSVTSGKVITLFADWAAVIVVDVPVVPPASNKILFVLSTLSMIAVVLSTNDLFVKVTTEAAPIKVSGPAGRVSVPPLFMLAIVGNVKVLFVRVSVVLRPISVSVASGKVITLFAV